MERLLAIKLDAADCEAEAWINGFPVARVSPAMSQIVLPVHEYALAGANQLELVIWPGPVQDVLAPPLANQATVATGQQWARLHLLLPRMGHPVDERSARSLAQIDWTLAAGTPYEAPCRLTQAVDLPVTFPRWRWLEAPTISADAVLRTRAATFLQQLASSLAQGDTSTFMATTRLRTEELSLAYQRDAKEEATRLQQYLQAAADAQRLNWLPMDEANLTLRPIVDGKLLDCLDKAGLPMLRTEPDAQGRSLAWPLRIAAVEDRFYVLR